MIEKCFHCVSDIDSDFSAKVGLCDRCINHEESGVSIAPRWSDFYDYSSDGHGYDSLFEDDGDYDD